MKNYCPDKNHYAGRRPARLYGIDEGNVGVRQRRIEGQMNCRLAAAVPVAVRHAGRKDDERAGPALVLRSLDLDAHAAAQDVKDLIDGVRVHAARGAAARGRFDAIDAAMFGTRRVIEQLLGQALIGAALFDGLEINHANIFHWNLLSKITLV